MRRLLVAVLAVLMLTLGAQAEPFRTLLLTDDQIVELGGREMGIQVQNIDSLFVDDADVLSLIPYIRYGLFEKMTAYVLVPFQNISSDVEDDEAGLADMGVGFNLLADDGSENNCSIMTTLELNLPTGDEDKRLGDGDVGLMMGIALGINLDPDTSFIFEGRYEIVPEGDDILTYGIGVVHEVSPRLWFTVEGEGTDQEFDGESPALMLVGMTYKGFCDVKGLMLSIGGGTGLTSVSPSGAGSIKLAYSF